MRASPVAASSPASPEPLKRASTSMRLAAIAFLKKDFRPAQGKASSSIALIWAIASLSPVAVEKEA